jgi:hypothetical protein
MRKVIPILIKIDLMLILGLLVFRLEVTAKIQGWYNTVFNIRQVFAPQMAQVYIYFAALLTCIIALLILIIYDRKHAES